MRLVIEVENKAAPYEISPEEFLNWARLDLDDRKDERRSIGNAVGNIKRAIHCWIDNYLNNLNISLCGNWPNSMNTYEKIELMKPFGLRNNAIVGLLTKIRNEFEHDYKLVDRESVEAYYETTDLWISDANNNYITNRIALLVDAKTIREINGFNYYLEVSSDAHIEYFWFTKKMLFEYKKGKLTETKYLDIDYKELSTYLINKIKGLYRQDRRIVLPQSRITYIYKKLFEFSGDFEPIF